MVAEFESDLIRTRTREGMGQKHQGCGWSQNLLSFEK
jgi:DNA invertase Pin-like site-specific DNA recombinase